MFPIMNATAKGMLKFMYNISSSIGSNLFKLAVGSGTSDEDQFMLYFDETFAEIPCSWFKH